MKKESVQHMDNSELERKIEYLRGQHMCADRSEKPILEKLIRKYGKAYFELTGKPYIIPEARNVQ